MLDHLTPEQFNELMFILMVVGGVLVAKGVLILFVARIAAWFAAVFIGWIVGDMRK